MTERRNITDGSFKGIRFAAAKPSKDFAHGTTSVRKSARRRLQRIQRPLVDGARVRDWGSEPRTFEAEIIFLGPTYRDDFGAFEALFSQGSPGTLILPNLPKAVWAYIESMSEAMEANGGDSLTCSVTWVEHTEAAVSGQSTAAVLSPPTVDEAKANLDSSLSSGLGILSNNPVLAGIRAVESGLSTVKGVVNFVAALDSGIRNRIVQLGDEIKTTFQMIGLAAGIIKNAFGSDSATAQASLPSIAQLGTDIETGQAIADFSAPDQLTPPVNPLSKPPAAVNVTLPTTGMDTKPGIQSFLAQVTPLLAAQAVEIEVKMHGRGSDIAQAIRNVSAAVNVLGQAALGPPKTTYTTPFKMSLAEVLFLNGIDLGRLNVIHDQNTFIDDPCAIPAGTQISL